MAVLPKRVAPEVFCQPAVGNAGDIVDVGGVEKRSSFQYENSFLGTNPVRQIIRQYSTADSRADDDNVKVFAPADVLQKQTLPSGRVLRDKIYVGRKE